MRTARSGSRCHSTWPVCQVEQQARSGAACGRRGGRGPGTASCRPLSGHRGGGERQPVGGQLAGGGCRARAAPVRAGPRAVRSCHPRRPTPSSSAATTTVTAAAATNARRRRRRRWASSLRSPRPARSVNRGLLIPVGGLRSGADDANSEQDENDERHEAGELTPCSATAAIVSAAKPTTNSTHDGQHHASGSCGSDGPRAARVAARARTVLDGRA